MSWWGLKTIKERIPPPVYRERFKSPENTFFIFDILKA
jgi:hypothetical protein